MARFVVDARERKLSNLFGDLVETETLDVGDILCTYEDGSGWVAERKTASDLAKSLKDGRWAEQKDRLSKSGLTVVYIIEGELKEDAAMHGALLSSLVRAEVVERVHVFRTWDLKETKRLLELLREKMPEHCHVANDTLATSKRKKDNSLENIWIRQIACIPLFSESVARAILLHFGSLRDLQEALRAPAPFPDVPIHPSGSLLGKARIEKLREVFA